MSDGKVSASDSDSGCKTYRGSLGDVFDLDYDCEKMNSVFCYWLGCR